MCHHGCSPADGAVLTGSDRQRAEWPGLCGFRGRFDTPQNVDELGNFPVGEQAFGPQGREICERRLVETSGIHDSAFGEAVDDEVHELDLVAVELVSCQELGERLLGGTPVETRRALG